MKSIVSRRLFRLEAELGVQLLLRTTRGAALTEAGSTIREHAARIGAEIEMAKETLLPTGDLRGRLRISVPLSFSPTHFAPVLAELAHRHTQLRVHTSCSDRFVDLVAEGFDCAIRVGTLTELNLIAKRIGKGTESWQLMDGDKIITVQPQERFKADNGTALTLAAVAGLGVAYLPDCLTHRHVASGALVATSGEGRCLPSARAASGAEGVDSDRHVDRPFQTKSAAWWQDP